MTTYMLAPEVASKIVSDMKSLTAQRLSPAWIDALLSQASSSSRSVACRTSTPGVGTVLVATGFARAVVHTDARCRRQAV